MFKNNRKYAKFLNVNTKKAIAAAGLLSAGLALTAATNFATIHRKVEATYVSPVALNSPASLQADFSAIEEAEELTAAIENLDKITLTSASDLARVRESYNHASKTVQDYVDDAALVKAEREYKKLESEREDNLRTAINNGDLNTILDYAQCEVTYSGDEYLDSLVADVIDKATTDEMSRSEKLSACYDYLVANFTYEYNYNYSYGGSKKSIAWATCFLRDGYGACNNWNSAFMYIGKALGYDVKLCYGATATSRGGSVEHYWTEFKLGDTTYVFDPQVEGDMTRKSGVNGHSRFGLTGEKAEQKYFFGTYVD